MILTKHVLNFKSNILNGLCFLTQNIATLIFNFPKNPGMPITPTNLDQQSIFDFNSSLPTFSSRIPSIPTPRTFLQALFGNIQKINPIERIFYEHKSQGYYNFYVKNYQNIFFLPNWLSRWIQLNCNICIDTTSLEIIRESIFFGLLSFTILLQFRLKLYWFLTINPYTRPWIYMISLTDWVYDFMSGFTPTSFGIDISPMIVLGIIGKLMDSLNSLVFTMPFLPTEGIPGKLMINKELTDVLFFRYLPSLWYTHFIPNSLRNVWYHERPEIFSFMKQKYGHLNIKLLPDNV